MVDCATSDSIMSEDEKQEGTRSFTLALSNAEGENIVEGSATGTIAHRELRQWLRTSTEGRNVEAAVARLLAGG